MKNLLLQKIKLIYKIVSIDISNISVINRFKFTSKRSFNNLLVNFNTMTDEELKRYIQIENLKYKLNKIEQVSDKVSTFFINNVNISKKINVHLLEKAEKVKGYEIYTVSNKNENSMTFIRIQNTPKIINIYFTTLKNNIN